VANSGTQPRARSASSLALGRSGFPSLTIWYAPRVSTIGRDDIDTRVLRTVVGLMPGVFVTKDVSEHATMLAAHPAERGAFNYHAMVGKALSEERTALGITETAKGTARGSRWARTAAGRASSAQSPAPSARPGGAPPSARPAPQTSPGIGPQHSRDSPFTRRMRRHQSWWRATVLGVPWGTGPMSTSERELGSMLRREDGERGLNFLTPAIHATAMARLSERQGKVEPFRLLHNLLSSQPMCFNLFGPLVEDRRLATDLMRALLPGEVEEVLSVRIEYAPEPAANHLADSTAFDALVVYMQPNKQRAFLGIETKLTERFSQESYDTEAYRRWMRHAPVWKEEAWGRVAHIDHNQLWRDHLLAVSMLGQPGSEWGSGRLALVRHPLDTDCEAVTRGYISLLLDGHGGFRNLTLDHIVSTWLAAAGPEHRPWLEAFRLRYLDLAHSEGG
jgi:hypothetical protein